MPCQHLAALHAKDGRTGGGTGEYQGCPYDSLPNLAEPDFYRVMTQLLDVQEPATKVQKVDDSRAMPHPAGWAQAHRAPLTAPASARARCVSGVESG